jgi:hypothetical protein
VRRYSFEYRGIILRNIVNPISIIGENKKAIRFVPKRCNRNNATSMAAETQVTTAAPQIRQQAFNVSNFFILILWQIKTRRNSTVIFKRKYNMMEKN